MKTLFILAVFAGLISGCGGESLTAIDDLTPNSAALGKSGCNAVSGSIEETGTPPTFVGAISGDLEGTTYSEMVGGFSAGPVNHNELDFTYSITGGIVPELIGMDLHLSASKLIAASTQDNPDVSRINGTLSVESPGSGHLTLHGSADFAGFPPIVLSLEYRGVVCL